MKNMKKTRKLKRGTVITFIAAVAAVCTLFCFFSFNTAASASGDVYRSEANANLWGRSDLREYMSGTEKQSNTLLFDSTHSKRAKTGYYESQFSDSEYAVILPAYYVTAFRESASNSCTDRFWLPSANYTNDTLMSWGVLDVSTDSAANSVLPSRVIPISYWAGGASTSTWTRSSYRTTAYTVLAARRGNYVISNTVTADNVGVAALLKLDLSSVNFASSASAAELAANGGAKVTYILGSQNFGKKTNALLPDYGMYLKQTNTIDSFDPTTVSLNGTTLTVKYNGGTEGKYVVVQAFGADSLTAGTVSYEAATMLQSGSTEASMNVSAWNLNSLNGYTVKVWMEDVTMGSSMASATAYSTFVVGSDGSIVETTAGSIHNIRVFATNTQLGTSWGDLSEVSDLVGTDATNQKIYLGYNNGPLQFWIAGRESYRNGGSPEQGEGTINPYGDVMTLYQAKTVEMRSFNASTANYLKVPKLTLEDNCSYSYSGEAKAPAYTYTYNNINLFDAPAISYQYRLKGSSEEWTSGLPLDAGEYEVQAIAPATEYYESVMSEPVSYTITEVTPTFTEPTLIPVEVTYGTHLSQVPLDSIALGCPTYQGEPVRGRWEWADLMDTGNVGTHTFLAIFISDTDNFITDDIMVNVPVTVIPAPINVGNIIMSDSEFTYSGFDQMPSIIIKDKFDNYLIEGIDFDGEAIGDRTQSGIQEICIKFKGNYASDSDGDGIADNPNKGVVVSYVIKPASLDVSGVSLLDKKYDGKTDATVKEVTFAGLNGTDALTLGIDYTVTAVFDNASPGENRKVEVIIKLMNTAKAKNYIFDGGDSITVQGSADIVHTPISDATAELEYTSAKYTGREITPLVILRINLDGVNETVLVNNVDYEISYLDNVNAGTATVVVTGKGSFSSSAVVGTVVIEKADPILTVTENSDKLVYNGAEQKLLSSVTVIGGALEYSLDGTVWGTEIPSAKNAGDYTVYYRVKVAENYNDIGVGSVAVSIARKNITVAANNETSCIGTEAPAFTYTVSGLVDGETLSFEPTLTSEALMNAAGEYDILVNGNAEDGNYVVSYTKGTLTVREHTDENGDLICDSGCGKNLSNNGLGVGAIVGIVVGAVAIVGLGGFFVAWFVIKKKK